MLCLQCGKEVGEGAKFCPHCGAVTAASAPGPEPAPGQGGGPEGPVYRYGTPQKAPGPGGDPWDAPAPGEKKGGKKGLLIGGAIAAVAVVAALAVALSGLFSSPKGQVEKAAAKTLSAYADAGKGMGLPNLAELGRSGSVSQSFRVELNSVSSELTGYDLSALGGLGVSVSGDCDREGRRLGGELAVFWGENEIASVQMAADDNVLSFASPQFTKGDAYGVDTETLGADLARLGVEDDRIPVEDIGFNLFDLVEQGVSGGQDEDAKQAAREAGKRLAQAVEVEKNGRKEITVNGKSVNAAGYRVVIPQEAMEEYMDAMEDIVKLADGQEGMRQLLQAIGLGEDVIDEITSEAAAETSYDEVFDALGQMFQAMGDLELDVYLDGGYVCAVEYAKEVDGETLEIGLYLGGGGRYVDDLSLRIAAGGGELLVESSGSHGGKGGVFTDRTVFRVRSGGSTAFRVSSDFRYEPKALSGNFGWKLNVNNAASVEMSGQLTAGKDSVNLRLDDVRLRAAGMEVCSLAVDYSAGPCRDVAVSLPAPALLGDMDEGDLLELYYTVEENAQEWGYDMIGLIPEDLLWAFYG